MQAVEADAMTGQHQGTVRTAGADPNDPALHGLSEEPSGHSLGGTPRFSPPGPPSFTHATSFSSTHGSPASRSALEQSDSFSRHLSSGKSRPEHEGVELGMIKGDSHNLAEEMLAEQLHSFAPSATSQAEPSAQAGSTPSAHTHAHVNPALPHSHGKQQQTLGEAAAADDVSGSNMQSQQPVSFQSLAALASSHAARAKQVSDPSGAAGTVDDAEGQARSQVSSRTALGEGPGTATSPNEGSLPDAPVQPPAKPDFFVFAWSPCLIQIMLMHYRTVLLCRAPTHCIVTTIW